jgi:Zn-finger nucleic acid-binding protein
MRCLACKSDMIVVEHNRIELDYCTKCHGVWFDFGELELLVEAAGFEGAEPFLASLATATETKSSEKKRRCPICLKKMRKTLVGQKPEILIDLCRRGDGLWFDGGELGQLLEQLAGKSGKKPTPQQEVFNFLQEVFKTKE